MRRMRVLIQSTISHLFLKSRDAATQNPDEARDFKQASKALLFIRQNKMIDVQIVLKFPKVSDDVNLTILQLLTKEQKKSCRKESHTPIHFRSVVG